LNAEGVSADLNDLRVILKDAHPVIEPNVPFGVPLRRRQPGREIRLPVAGKVRLNAVYGRHSGLMG
jgi:hypothetical protein